MIYTRFEDIPRLRYRLLMVDPPWRFTLRSEANLKKSPAGQYQCMSLDEIKALPVDHLAYGDAYLFLWATNPMLDQAFDVLRAWGARFVTAGHWVKRTNTGKLAFGGGYVLRSAGEPFLIGAWGNPPILDRSIRSVIEGERRRHSEKPDEAFAVAERMSEGPFIEVFSRTSRPGWDSFGLEAGKFDPVPAVAAE